MFLKKQSAFLFILIVLLPITMQLEHALNHNHQYSDSENSVHLHEINSDCTIYHQQINHNSFDLSIESSIKNVFFINENPLEKKENQKDFYVITSTPRAPPSLLFI